MRIDEKNLRFLDEITERIVSTGDPDKIILFGSYARSDLAIAREDAVTLTRFALAAT
jgi:hypothetical protein